MRGAFSERLRKKLEENPIFRKTIIRVFTFSLALGIIYSAIGYSFFNFLSLKLNNNPVLPFILIVITSVFIGGISGLFVFGNILTHIKRVIQELSNDSPRWDWLEKEYIESEIRNLYLGIKKLHLTVSSQAKLVGVAQLASQVAHDIRSPLAALNMIIKQASVLPESQRIIIRNATQQIDDIANNLLIVHHRKEDVHNEIVEAKPVTQPELIFTLLDNVLSAKRAQYSECEMNIQLNITSDAYNIFANINPVDFNRVISNLINNAIEAMQYKGVIHVNLSKLPDQLQITMQDNGGGMSAELIEKVLRGGISVGKKIGYGLGLASSKNKIESWGGTFTLISQPGQGTMITLRLPAVLAPHWFQQTLEFTEGGVLVILDDDRSIHDVWELRVQEELNAKDKLQLMHFDQADTFLNYNFTQIKNIRYLIDYELLGSQITGLDVIEKLQIANQAILVTSRYEDTIIRSRCEKLGCKILPKNYASYIPMSFAMQPDIVLIDDDRMLTKVWQVMGESQGKEVMIFHTANDARRALPSFAKNTLIYIDSHLSEHEKGEHFAKELYDLGFCNLYLATGYDPHYFKESLPWIKKIVGKEYPS